MDWEALLLSELTELQEVELWRLHWCLSHDLVQDFPPIPSRWLRSADAFSTAKTMLSCYHEEGALMMLSTALTLIGRDDWVCQLHLHTDPPRPRLAPKPDPDFVKTQRRKLISRIQWLDRVLDTLQADRILNTTNRDAINIYAVQKEKNRALVDLVLRKGDDAQEMFYKALSQSEPFLLQELEYGPIMVKVCIYISDVQCEDTFHFSFHLTEQNLHHPEVMTLMYYVISMPFLSCPVFISQNPSETSVPTEMLEFLVSDELRSFQWLVSDHMTGERFPPIGGEELQHADRPTTQRFLGKHFGPKQLENITKNVLLKIVPTLSMSTQSFLS